MECLGRDGLVLGARQRWPFVTEPGYDYPHVHQAASLSSSSAPNAAGCGALAFVWKATWKAP